MADHSDNIVHGGVPTKEPPRISIARGGGLARGFAHIGVLNVLERHGIKPDIVAGTSIGSVVGAAFLAGKMDDMEEWALSLNRFKMLSYLDLKMRQAGIIGGKRLLALLNSHFKNMTVEDLPSPYAAIATDLVTGHEVWIRKGSLVQAMQASFALPGVFPPVQRNHRFLVDGALVDPIPIAACRAMGARMTIAVDLHADIIGKSAKAGNSYQTVTGFDLFNDADVPPEEQEKHKTPLTTRLFGREEESPSLFGVMVSSLGIMMDRLTRSRLAGDPPDVHIKPQIGHIGLLEFEKAAELIDEGEAAALRALPEIKAAMQVYLVPEDDEP